MKRSILTLIAGTLMISACGTSSYTFLGERDPTQDALRGVVVQGGKGIGGCTLPPDFQESDLVGTWVAKYGSEVTDTLILKADGTYKQIYDEITGDHFESDWQKWWVEYGGSGTPHLHLQGMRKCDQSRDDCLRGRGGAHGQWFDFCEGRVIRMSDEVILLVAGVPSNYFDPPPRGIFLYHLQADPDTSVSKFRLQE